MSKNSKAMMNVVLVCVALGIGLAFPSRFTWYQEFREKFIDGPTTDLIIGLVILAVMIFVIYFILYSLGIVGPGT
jgi:hypothetical protein